LKVLSQLPLGNSSLGLRVIDLSYNNFIGQIPTSFGNLSNLTFLNLTYNHLVARDDQDWEFLINTLRNCKSLEVLALTSNKLQGSIPQSIGNLSTSHQELLLGDNSLSGQVPHSIGKLSGLIKLDIGENYLSGTIEGWIENLKNLQVLCLQSNHFTGQIPSSIGNLTQLAYLYLNGNEFEGSIPDSLGTLQYLQKLDLSYNNLQEDEVVPSMARLLPPPQEDEVAPDEDDC